MKRMGKVILMVLMCVLLVGALSQALAAKDKRGSKAAKHKVVPAAKASYNEEAWETWSKPNAAFDAAKMGDMSGYDPAKWVNPEGDTIKIAVVWPH
ncbi:MAG: hypothetical protein PHI33_01210, partial [Smithellaceae bacterium]|nr:hypothetical protein [Smithellaceae bacterium]